MKIAVIGSGFCGLACAWYLSEFAHCQVVLYDDKGIGAGASGLSSGLLHAYAGPKGKRSWEGAAALPESLFLLNIASGAIGFRVYSDRGILRPQVAGLDFSHAFDYPDVEWWDAERCQKAIPELAPLPGMFIRSGLTVNCRAYLEGLWLSCKQKKVTFELGQVEHPSDLSGYDFLIFTVGADLHSLKDVHHPPVERILGQSLELEWQKEAPLLPFALNAGVQLSQIEPHSVWVGATYERLWQTLGPDSGAESEIRRKLAQMAPSFAALPLKNIWANFRAATKDKRPFIAQTGHNIFCLGGMGSKGLLYHAFMAKSLALQIASCAPTHAPQLPC